ncbi:MAG: methylmalonyl-CoA mutase small subunit [Bacteroidales bacterium]|nr:methylmalonyl-CoA mutase small subunit [Bacteroidales bacterium]MBN2748723.1 methylmalonyl-CoA mutase small subunit [Bacteroidales bacterium]
MAENTKDSKLFAEFPPVTTEQWEAVIQQDLKGADYDKRLVWKTMEGISVRPYYRAEDLKKLQNTNVYPGTFPFVRGNGSKNNAWLIRQDFDACNPTEANAKALRGIERGLTAVGFVICDKCEPNAEGMSTLLKGIDLSKVEVNFIAGGISRRVLPLFIEKAKAAGVNVAEVKASFDYSPLTSLSLKGKFCKDAETSFAHVKEVVEMSRALPNLKAVSANGAIFQNSGATAVQELAFALSMANEYMAKLTDMGINAEEAASRIKFTFAVGANYFMEIAKFRAARMLWAKIADAYGVKNSTMCIHAETSEWNMTVYDPYVNMLRTTTEGMSAVIAGVHSLTVHPFDKPYQKATVFSERIARNQQLLLKEEVYLDKVVDPSAGSYYIETLTTSVADHAWSLFNQIEAKGGYTKAFMEGFIQNEIKTIAAKRDSNIVTRRDTILGTNQYPNFSEVADTKIVTKDTFKRGCTCGCENAEAIAEPLAPYRGAMTMEALRYRTDASGRRPKAFMLAVGNLAFRRARAQFSCNFFACAGFDVVDNIGFKSIDEGVKAAMDAKSDIVVICSSDDEYATLAPEAFQKLGNKAILTVAGDPACKPELEAAGIKNFISVKSNLLETLRGYQEKLGL